MISLRNRQEFINYCLRKLGQGVWEIELTPDQLEDCVNDAIAEFEERHAEGSSVEYITFQPTKQEIEENSWTLPQNVLQVVEIVQSQVPNMATAAGGGGGSFPLMNTWANTTFNLPSMRRGMFYYGMQNYVIWRSYLETINQVMQPVKHFRFNYTSKILKLDFPIEMNSIVVVKCILELNENAYINIYNNAWVKSFCTALMKKQWGENMTKYTVDLGSNGTEINGAQKLSEAIAEIAELKEELREKYSNAVQAKKG